MSIRIISYMGGDFFLYTPFKTVSALVIKKIVLVPANTHSQ
jgi:hypothetical protein